VKSAVETLNATRVKLTVEVPFEELKPSLDAAYKTIGSQIQVPGFRKGKVPARIIDQRLGRGAVLQEAVNDALPKFYGQAVEDNKVRPLGQPEVDITEVPAEAGQELKFTAEVDVRPQITLPDYEGLQVEVDAVAVDEDSPQVAERMTALRERFGTLTGVERPVATGDFVSLDLTATIGDEEIDTVKGISYEVGTESMLDGLDDALAGVSAQETTSFTTALAGGDRVGEDAHVVVTVQSVKERVLPELDDDFAQLASEFDTLEELQADLVKQADRAVRFEQGAQARDKLLETLLAQVEIPVPDAVIEAEVTEHLEGEGRLEDEEHRAEVTSSAQEALRTRFLLDAIAEKEQVSVGQQELIEYLVMTAQQYNMEPNEFAKVIDENNQIPAMVSEVARRKALATVLEKASIIDTAGNVVDLNALNAEISSELAAAEEAAAAQAAAAQAKAAPAEDSPVEDSPAVDAESDHTLGEHHDETATELDDETVTERDDVKS